MAARGIFFKASPQNSSSFSSIFFGRRLIWGGAARWFRPVGRVRVAGQPMKSSTNRKCRHCKELYRPDRRNLHHQRFCSEPACRKRSKAESQRRWQQKPQNQNYFRGRENCERVGHWRSRHPGYWRKKKSAPAGPLQDVCTSQVAQNQPLAGADVPSALQDVFVMQPAVLVGLISTMTGSTLQEDIALTTRALFAKGQDILGPNSPGRNPADCNDQTPPLSRTAAPCAAAI